MHSGSAVADIQQPLIDVLEDARRDWDYSPIFKNFTTASLTCIAPLSPAINDRDGAH